MNEDLDKAISRFACDGKILDNLLIEVLFTLLLRAVLMYI